MIESSFIDLPLLGLPLLGLPFPVKGIEIVMGAEVSEPSKGVGLPGK
jgi:hypothetical protein